MIIRILQGTALISPEELQSANILKYFKEIKLFKELNLKDDVMYEILAVMQYERYKKNHMVFNYEDVGDKFYIILKGHVSVLLPYKLNNEGNAVRVDINEKKKKEKEKK